MNLHLTGVTFESAEAIPSLPLNLLGIISLYRFKKAAVTPRPIFEMS